MAEMLPGSKMKAIEDVSAGSVTTDLDGTVRGSGAGRNLHHYDDARPRPRPRGRPCCSCSLALALPHAHAPSLALAQMEVGVKVMKDIRINF